MTSFFERTWARPRGWRFITHEVNNQPIGRRMMATALAFFVTGGVLALLMRIQLVHSEAEFIGPEWFNRLFTMHGATMMYLFAVPFLEGLALFLTPLLIGARDMAFPRLSSFGFWCYIFGGVLFYLTFAFGMVPDAGWFAYTPLSTSRFSGRGMDFFLLALGLVEVAGIAAGIEIVVTILKLRTPGMTLARMPILAWTFLVMAVMILFAFSVLLIATVLLELDRTLGTAFFDPVRGGSTLLWQHLFWFFGHPEVYIIFLPATGIISTLIPVFAHRPLAGRALVIMSVVVIGFVSFGLWVHHMFATGLPEFASGFFTAASLMIALASGTQIFAWIATLWRSKPSFEVPFLFVLGFFFIFVLGGLTGVMVAVVPFDLQVHDTYFVVAHFHYVLIGGVVFPILGGLYYWFPKITGRVLGPRLGKWSFWTGFIGFNAAFFPMHFMGLEGMPRRVYTYPSSLNLDAENLVATLGSFLFAASIGLMLLNIFRSYRRPGVARANPWGSDSLEWSVPSPPPSYSFARPPVDALVPPAAEYRELAALLDRKPERWRGTVVTQAFSGVPQAIQALPGPSHRPFVAAFVLASVCVSVVAQAYILALASGVAFGLVLLRWLWPTLKMEETVAASELPQTTGLTVTPVGTHSVAWWGTLCLVTVLATVFGALFFSYFYIRLYSPVWPQSGLPLPRWEIPLAGVVALLVSAAFRKGGAALLGGGVYIGLNALALSFISFGPRGSTYGSLFWTLNAMAMLLAAVGMAFWAVVVLRKRKGFEQPERSVLPVQIASLFWKGGAALAVITFFVVWVSPYVV